MTNVGNSRELVIDKILSKQHVLINEPSMTNISNSIPSYFSERLYFLPSTVQWNVNVSLSKQHYCLDSHCLSPFIPATIFSYVTNIQLCVKYIMIFLTLKTSIFESIIVTLFSIYIGYQFSTTHAFTVS